MCVNTDAKKKLTIFSPLQIKNKPDDGVQFVRLFLNPVLSRIIRYINTKADARIIAEEPG